MIEYKDHIDIFSLEGSWWFSQLIPESQWGNKELAKSYLKKYWLSEDEYNGKWKSIQNNIFNSLDISLPDLIFKNKYELIALRGGCLFLKEDFIRLQKCLLKMGEKYLVIVENTFEGKLQEPSFRMKYPVTITWDELISGNFISSTIIENLYKEFFVFGESGNWGKYSANDYIWPLDIMGFKPEYGSIFRSEFKQSEKERKEIKKWLPSNYRERI